MDDTITYEDDLLGNLVGTSVDPGGGNHLKIETNYEERVRA